MEKIINENLLTYQGTFSTLMKVAYTNVTNQTLLIEKVFQNIHVLTSEPYVRVIACYNDAGLFLPPDLIFMGFNQKDDLADRLLPESDVYMNRKSSYISTHLFTKTIRAKFLKHNTSGQVIFLQMNEEIKAANFRASDYC